jgi:hypothetical protein
MHVIGLVGIEVRPRGLVYTAPGPGFCNPERLSIWLWPQVPRVRVSFSIHAILATLPVWAYAPVINTSRTTSMTTKGLGNTGDVVL